MSIKRFQTATRMSQAVVHGGTVYLAGQVAQGAAGKSVTEQTKDILSRIDAVAVADVRRVAEELIRGTPPTLAAIGPLDGLEGLSDIAGRLGTGVAALA